VNTETTQPIGYRAENKELGINRSNNRSPPAIVEGSLKVAPIDLFNNHETAKLDAMRLEYKPKDIEGGQHYLSNERKYDQHSFLLGIYSDSELIGSIRFIPFTEQSPYLKKLGQIHLEASERATTAEASRLFINRKHRWRVRLALYLISTWVLEHTELRKYIAISVDQFVPLYLAGGAEVLRRNIALEGRENCYSLVQGTFKKMLNIKTATKNNRDSKMTKLESAPASEQGLVKGENEALDKLTEIVDARWEKIKKGKFWSLVSESGFNFELYQHLMHEIYFYTRQNAINQAAAAYKGNPDDTLLLKFVFKHALEELGHEKMVLHDLQSVGLTLPAPATHTPLPATTALIGYLYHVALVHGPKARLGYSFWAEDVYRHIDFLLQEMRRSLGLKDKNMSFFVSHSTIDQKHSQEVNEMIRKFVKTEDEIKQISEVTETTLYLTGELMEQVAEAYLDNRLADAS